MLKIENAEVVGWKHAIRGMRNHMNSWAKSDSHFDCNDLYKFCDQCGHYLDGEDGGKHCEYELGGSFMEIGPNDLDLMKRLRNAGTDHRKFMRMIVVYVDLTGPLYWWKEFKTYRAGRKFGNDEPDLIPDEYLEYDIEMNSCSTMHKIADKKLGLEDFSHEHLIPRTKEVLIRTIDELNYWRSLYLNGGPISLSMNSSGTEVAPKDKHVWWQMIQLLPTSYNQRRTVMLNYEVLANIYKSRRNHKLDEWHTFCDWIETLPYSEIICGEEGHGN